MTLPDALENLSQGHGIASCIATRFVYHSECAYAQQHPLSQRACSLGRRDRFQPSPIVALKWQFLQTPSNRTSWSHLRGKLGLLIAFDHRTVKFWVDCMLSF